MEARARVGHFALGRGESAVGEDDICRREAGLKHAERAQTVGLEISPFFDLTAGIVGQVTGIVLALAAYHGE
jgi:hypothetical protein